MASGGWQISSFPAAGVAAAATQAAPSAATLAGNSTLRLRGIQASLACTASAAATTAQIQVLDGATAIFNDVLSAPVSGRASVAITDLDLRATPGNNLTVQFVAAGATSAQHVVNAQGDIVPVGYPLYLP